MFYQIYNYFYGKDIMKGENDLYSDIEYMKNLIQQTSEEQSTIRIDSESIQSGLFIDISETEFYKKLDELKKKIIEFVYKNQRLIDFDIQVLIKIMEGYNRKYFHSYTFFQSRFRKLWIDEFILYFQEKEGCNLLPRLLNLYNSISFQNKCLTTFDDKMFKLYEFHMDNKLDNFTNKNGDVRSLKKIVEFCFQYDADIKISTSFLYNNIIFEIMEECLKQIGSSFHLHIETIYDQHILYSSP